MIKQYYAIIMQSYKIKNRKKNEGRIILRCVLKILFLGYLQVRKNTFRPLFVFNRCKVSSLISHDARITPSSTYTFHSTKIQKSPRQNL